MLAPLMNWMSVAAVKFEATFLKAFSFCDRPGTIYAFRIVDGNHNGYLYKIGRTSRPLEQRIAEWNRQCPSYEHVLYGGVRVAHSHRVERLVHLALMSEGHNRVIKRCVDCGKNHQEIFDFDTLDEWEDTIKPLIERISEEVES
ncbi:hypothetical protein MPER_10000 [Moniliophthora perniciosa FA553]|nr:hypothetical protein MPER_10000 [Moniliophthora perniciosa FA553]